MKPLFDDIYEKLFKEESKNFCGREELIDKKKLIDQCFENSSRNRCNIFLLYGTNGTGKTQTAIKYACLHKDFYDIAIKINAESISRFIDNYIGAFEEIYKIFDIPELERNTETAKDINNNLMKLPESFRVLLIIDNVSVPSDILDYLPQYRKNIHIILTSNVGYIGEKIPARNIHQLVGLDSHSSRKLVKKFLMIDNIEENNQDFIDINQPQMDELIDKFICATGNLPLSILVACASIKEQYPKEYKQYEEVILQFINTDPSFIEIPYIDVDLDATFQNNIKKCYKNIYRCLDQAIENDKLQKVDKALRYKLLVLISLLGNEIPRKQASAFLKITSDELNTLLKRFLVRNLIELSDHDNIIKVQPLINNLIFHYLINNQFQLPVFKVLVKNILNLEEVQNSDKERINDIPISNRLCFFERFFQLALNPNFPSAFYDLNLAEIKGLTKLVLSIINYQQNRGMFSRLEPELELVNKYYENFMIELNRKNLDYEKLKILHAKILNTVGYNCIDLHGEVNANKTTIYEFGKKSLELAISIRSDVLGEYDKNTIRSKNNLAVLNIVHRQFVIALNEVNKVIHYLEEFVKKDVSSENSIQYYQLSKMYDSMGFLLKTRNASEKDLSEAIEFYTKCIETYQLIKIHPKKMYFLPRTYTERGKTYCELASIDKLKREWYFENAKADFLKSMELHKEYNRQNSNKIKCEWPNSKVQNYFYIIKTLEGLQEKNAEAEIEKYRKEAIEFINECLKENGLQLSLLERKEKLESIHQQEERTLSSAKKCFII